MWFLKSILWVLYILHWFERAVKKCQIDIVTFYQQPGDTKKPYLAQYSNVVCEDAPVKASYTTIKNNIAIKNILNPLNIHFNASVMEVFLARVDNIIN
jgi:hypothetical protein